MNVAFFDKSISDAAADIRSGKAAARDAVARALELIEGRDGDINAFITVCKESALKKAEAIDELSSDQKKPMPLCGIPFAVKDNICTNGIRTTCASHMLEKFTPPYSAAVVEALEAAGAIIVGKTNLDEFAMGSATDNSFFGPTHNPHNHKKTACGSSDGSAAAIGAGFVPAALGTDTGGSIRQSSSHCGVVGIKPTYGRVSRYGAAASASSLDHIGPIANNVRDAGLLLSVISAPDKRDPTCAGKQFVDSPDFYRNDVSDLRIGVPAEYFDNGLSNEVRAAVEASIETLKSRGASIIDVSMPNLKYAAAAHYIISAAEASSNLARYDGVKFGFRADGAKSLTEMYEKTRSQAFGPEVKRRIVCGTHVLSSGYYDACYLKAARVRTLICADFTNVFKLCDVMVSPAAPVTAFGTRQALESNPLQSHLMDIYTVSANLAGIPALVVPCSIAPPSCNSPIGVQFMAPKWREDLVLRAGYAVGGNA